MNRFTMLLALAGCAISTVVIAQEEPGMGKLLVATDVVSGGVFEETVILLLNYDTAGAAGLVINRPTEALPAKALPEFSGLDQYDGSLYWGGPVELFTLRALQLSESPLESGLGIFDNVYLVPLEEDMLDRASNNSNLRFFVGYSGWAPGQLDRELATGSWHVAAATNELIFADDTDGMWRKLLPPPVRRVLLDDTKPLPSAVERPAVLSGYGL